MKIWSWNLSLTDRQIIAMPTGAKLLSVQKQNSEFKLWALVDDSAESVSRDIAVYGTGNPITEPCGIHISTVQDNSFVWHFFDLGEKQWPKE